MSETPEQIGTIGLELLLRVSQQGGGLYLYLPKTVTVTHGLRGGDLVQAKLGKVLRPVREKLEAQKVGKKDRRDD